MIGRTIGPYRILAELGRGGMGEVYRARDTSLDRDVALKMLPESFASDPDRLMRFEREAKTLASLNHPNIAAIYGMSSEAISGSHRPEIASELIPPVHAIVMELVEGRDLSEMIGASAVGAPGLRTGLPLDEALPIARQIAEALEAAHEAGIIHRDLKPANIKVRDDGTVKVLDFGLAKAFSTKHGAPGTAPGAPSTEHSALTMTSPALTQMGIILGTAAYMSPEQARGRPVDKRADIWAFGVVLFEMLSGRQLFQAATISDTIAALLRADIDLTALPISTPASIRRLIARCLDRDPRTRLQHIGEARIALQSVAAGDAAGDAAATMPESRWSPAVAGLLALTTVVGAVGWWLWADSTAPLPQADPVRAELVTLPPAQFRRTSMAFTSDGRTLVFTAMTADGPQLFRRDLDEPDIVPIAGTEGGRAPFLSPDDAWIGFSTDNAMKKVRLAGGTAETIRNWSTPGAIDVQANSWDTSGLPYGAAWLPDDTIVYGRFIGGLWRVSEDGGTPTPLTTTDEASSQQAHRFPHLSPDGRFLTFTSARALLGRMDVELLELASGKRTVLLEDASDARLTSNGHLLFARQGGLFTVRFDATTQGVSGEPVRVLADLRHFVGGGAPAEATGAADYALSSLGTLVFRSGGVLASPDTQLAWLSRGGAIEHTYLPAQSLVVPALSPDGRQVLVGSNRGLLRVDLDRRLETVLLPQGSWPVWLPDQSGLVFRRRGIHVMRFDQPEATRAVVQSEHPLWPSQVSHDGQWLFYVETHPVTGADIWVVGLNPVVPPRAILQTPADEGFPVLSPDGRWLAYSVREGDGGVAYVQPFPGPGERVRVSSVSGRRLGWTARGDGLLTAGEGEVFITAIDGRGPRIVIGATEVFTEQRTAGWSPAAALQVDRATGRLLATIRADSGPEASMTTPASLQLITNATALFDGGRK